MNDDIKEPDVLPIAALIAFVGLWGFFSCAAALQFATLS
jgi:hypothetical protein